MKFIVQILLFFLSTSLLSQTENAIDVKLRESVQLYDSIQNEIDFVNFKRSGLFDNWKKIKMKLDKAPINEKRCRDSLSFMMNRYIELGGNPETVCSNTLLNSLMTPVFNVDTAEYVRLILRKVPPLAVVSNERLSNLSEKQQKLEEYSQAIQTGLNMLKQEEEFFLKCNRYFEELNSYSSQCFYLNGELLTLTNLFMEASQKKVSKQVK